MSIVILTTFTALRGTALVPYSGKFLKGANFHIIQKRVTCAKIKTCENLFCTQVSKTRLSKSVFHTEGGVPWDFPLLSSTFPPQALLTSAIYLYYFPTPRASRPQPFRLKNHDSV